MRAGAFLVDQDLVGEEPARIAAGTVPCGNGGDPTCYHFHPSCFPSQVRCLAGVDFGSGEQLWVFDCLAPHFFPV